MILKCSIAFSCICGLVWMVFLPILIKCLAVVQRAFIILQQICIFGFLITITGRYAFLNKHFYQYFLNLVWHEDGLTAEKVEALRQTLLFVRNSFLYLYYFFSMMLTYDIYKMVYDPIKYKEFANICHILKCILIGFCCCLLLNGDDFSQIFAQLILMKIEKNKFIDGTKHDTFNRFSSGIYLFNIVKYILLKVVYSTIIAYLAIKTKNALKTMSLAVMNGTGFNLSTFLHWFNGKDQEALRNNFKNKLVTVMHLI